MLKIEVGATGRAASENQTSPLDGGLFLIESERPSSLLPSGTTPKRADAL
jgi:hypothetical protein